MDVLLDDTFKAGKAADLEILAELQEDLLECFLNGHILAGELCSLQCIEVSRVDIEDGLSQALAEADEFLVLCNEVGLRVDLNDCACGVVRIGDCDNSAFRSDAVSFLCLVGKTLLTEDDDCLLDIAVCLSQSLLAVHEADAGGLAEIIDVFCSKISHFLYPPVNYSAAASSSAAAASSAACASAPCLPSMTAFAMVPAISLTARIASSLPGMT